MAINEVLWNETRKELYVIDGLLGTLMVLDEKLNFIRKAPFHIPGFRYVVKDDYIYCGLGKDNYRNRNENAILVRYHILTGETEVLKRSNQPMFEPSTFPLFLFGHDLFLNDSLFCYREHRSDSIFCFTEDNLSSKLAYHINLGEIYPEALDYQHENRGELLNYVNVHSCMDLGKYLLIRYSYKSNNTSFALFNKSTAQVSCIDASNYNTMDYGPALYLSSHIKDRTFFAGWTSAERLCHPDFVSRVQLHSGMMGSSLLNIISTITEDDNPVLIFVSLKD